MRARFIVDTNVLIAASAASSVGLDLDDVTPKDPALRNTVHAWLKKFEAADYLWILDYQGSIRREYDKSRYLDESSYGMMVFIKKWDFCETDFVSIDIDVHGHGVLPDSLVPVIHDMADRKMVAAALEAERVLGKCPIAFAGDTDWHGWETVLTQHGVQLEPIIEIWSRQKYAEKQVR